MATQPTPLTDDIALALRHAIELLATSPSLAEEQAREIIKVAKNSVPAQKVLAASRRLQGHPDEALTLLQQIVESGGDDVSTAYERALCLAATGRGDDAITVLRQLLEDEPGHPQAWRTLGDQLVASGDTDGAEEAYERHLRLSTAHPELIEAATALRRGQFAKAESITRDVLKKDPTDVVAIRLLAAVGIKVNKFDDAISLLERCLELAPGFSLARQNYAHALSRRQRHDEAIAQVDKLLVDEPGNPQYRLLKASYLVQKGDHAEALKIYEDLVAAYPNQASAQMNFAHTLKAVGRLDEAIDAYRRSVQLRPSTGEVYWSLANLKTYQFDDDEITAMRREILPEGGDPDDQAHLLFALGKALEDRGEYGEAFACYEKGNRIRSGQHRHDARINVFNTARQIKALDAAFFGEREGWGCPTPDPIFVVGLPRAGSTLLEQILASHSQVEGTTELPDIIAISRRLAQRSRQHPAGRYPEILHELTASQARELGESYIESTRIQRHGAPFFIDKMPNNFQHIGLIHLILPNAKIIDARRHPMAGCFSCFKQLFAQGQTFTYNLADLGHYYRDYVKLMDHWDDVLPGRVHRVQYEDMVADTENQIRALLDYCGLEFEESCLRFYETRRAIRTPSSEQVRQPVYTAGLEQWRNFEPWLGPLKEALGPLLERYPVD